MNIANEHPSATLPAPSNKRPYRWQDGHCGLDADVGPYQVCVRWDWLGAEPKGGGSYAMLQIARADGGSVFDWRDMQAIKSAVLGDQWEGVEIFPSESRLKDPSNARYLWCCSNQLPFGLQGPRIVLDSIDAIAPQRPFAQIDARLRGLEANRNRQPPT